MENILNGWEGKKKKAEKKKKLHAKKCYQWLLHGGITGNSFSFSVLLYIF